MYPFIHIGQHFTIGTFGLLLWLAAVCACWVLHRNFLRFEIDADAIGIVAVVTVLGIIGAKLWHVADTPGEHIFEREGFAWFGGLVFGILALLWQGRATKIGAIRMLDLAAPAAAVGYGMGRLGCLISGDGDYGIPTKLPWGMSFPNGLVPTTQRVHPTPIYELIAGLVIGYYLWRRGAKRPRGPDYWRISHSERHRAVSGGVYPHQPQDLLGNEQCAVGKPRIDCGRDCVYRGCAVVCGTAIGDERGRRRSKQKSNIGSELTAASDTPWPAPAPEIDSLPP